MEKYYIYQEAYRGTQIDGKNTVLRSRIFDTLILYECRKRAEVLLVYFGGNNNKHFSTSNGTGCFTMA
jgi:hypothetical protein